MDSLIAAHKNFLGSDRWAGTVALKFYELLWIMNQISGY